MIKHSKIVQIISIIFLGISLASCEKEVKFDLNNTEKSVVLNALLKSDSTIAARVTFLKGLNQYTNLEPATAIVKLYENDVFIEDLNPATINGFKYYISKKKLSLSHKYKITVEVDGYPMIEGSDWIPEYATVNNGTLFITPTTNEGDQYNLHFDLTDNPNTNNYYRVRVLSTYTGWGPGGPGDTTYIRPQYFSFKNADMGETDIDGYTLSYEEYYFNDDVFKSNATKNIQLKFSSYNGNGTTDTSTYVLEVTSLTEASYNYFKTKSDAKYNNNDPFTEPSIVYSNIKNGLGIVGGIAHKRVNLKL